MCYTKTLPFKFIGVVLWLLNSQWKMHHCDVPSSFFLVFFGSAEHLYCFCALNSTSPPTHFTRAPPLRTKNRYLNSRLMILHASELETELFDEVQTPESKMYVCDIDRDCKAKKAYQRGRVTCKVLRNIKWRLTYS